MRIFEHFNQGSEHSAPCPVCKTKADKPTVLVTVDGTEEGTSLKQFRFMPIVPWSRGSTESSTFSTSSYERLH